MAGKERNEKQKLETTSARERDQEKMNHPMTGHDKTELLLELAMADNNEGLCMACGEIAECVEPDARKYECESCGESKVYGAQEALLMFV